MEKIEWLTDRIKQYIEVVGLSENQAKKEALKEWDKNTKNKDRDKDKIIDKFSEMTFIDFNMHIYRYNGNFYKYNFKDNIWYNLTDLVGTNQLPTIAETLKHELREVLISKYDCENVSFAAAKTIALNILSKIVSDSINFKHETNDNDAIFTNGIYDIETKKFYKNDNSKITVLPFSPYQIKFNYNEKAKPVKLVDELFDSFNSNDKLTRKAILQFIGSCLFPHNPSVFFILYSKHSTSGKGTIIEIIKRLITASSINTDKFFKNTNQFALSGLQDANAAYFNELPEHVSKDVNEKIKDLADSSSSLVIEKKGTNQQEIKNTHSWFATTNKMLNIHIPESALKKRIIWVELTLNKGSNELKFSMHQIKELLRSKESMEYIIKLAIDEYQKIYGGARNANWALPQSNTEFWLTPIEENKAVDIMMEMNEFEYIVTQKCNFVTNDMINKMLAEYKLRNPHERSFSTSAFKKSLRIYLEHLGCETEIPKIPKKINGHSKRGLEIIWPLE